MDITRSAVQTFTRQVVAEACDADGRANLLPAELRYETSDPYAVTVRFGIGTGSVVWTFARDLFDGGMLEPTGDGDVHVWPCLDDHGRAVVVVELCSPYGDALVHFRPEDVATFVDTMNAAVPVGEESTHLDLDSLVAELLGAAEES